MKKLLRILVFAHSGLINLNAQVTDNKNNFLLQEAPDSIKKSQGSDDKAIWKFNALGTLMNGFNVSYERKVAPNWSLNLNSVTGFETFTKNYSAMVGTSWALRGYGWRNLNIHQSLALQLRYYHNLERRKRLGKTTGFSGNYFALEIKSGINSYNRNEYWFWGPNERENLIFSAVSLQYGIQRRIGKMGYVDGSIGMGISHIKEQQFSEFYFLPTVKLGVGIAF